MSNHDNVFAVSRRRREAARAASDATHASLLTSRTISRILQCSTVYSIVFFFFLCILHCWPANLYQARLGQVQVHQNSIKRQTARANDTVRTVLF